MLPNFLVIGSQKSGTTTLHSTLSKHSDVFMPGKKELNYFLESSEYSKGVRYYEGFFQKASQQIAIGEASPGYICHPDAPERIYECLPSVKLILIVRNPIERAYSQYWDNRRHLTEWLSFEESIEHWLKREYNPGERGYFSRGLYIIYINRYLKLFPRENMLILQLDELKQEPIQFFHKCCIFLGIDPNGIPKHLESSNKSYIWKNPIYKHFLINFRLNRYLPSLIRRLICRGRKTGFKYPPMSEESLYRLKAFYQPFNEELASFLKKDLGAWLS